MDEIADLIRLLASSPAEEAPLTRPKEMLDRIAIERAVNEGIVPYGPAVPPATPTEVIRSPGNEAVAMPAPVSRGNPSQFHFPESQFKAPAVVNPSGQEMGVEASPRVAEITQKSPVQPVAPQPSEYRPAKPLVPQTVSGLTANPRTGIPDVPMTVKVMAPETFLGRVATPKILEAIKGMPANPVTPQSYVGVANPTPQSQVTITVPPAFPHDPTEAFAAVDDLIDLPPRAVDRDIEKLRARPLSDSIESTEAYVARSYQNGDGRSSDTDRWVL